MPVDKLYDAIASNTINTTTGLESRSPLDRAISFSPSLIKEEPISLGRYGVGESKYDTDIHPEDVYNLEEIRGEQQPGIAQFGAAVNQAVIGEIIGGTMEGIGHLVDMGDAIKVAKGEEVELGNFLTEAGQSLRTWGQEATPIYKTYDQGEFAPGHWSWWMSNAPSVASTLSMLIPTAGAVRGISALGKLAKIGETSAKVGKALGMTEEAIGLAGQITKGVGSAIISRHIENLLEANGSFQEVKNAALVKGMSEEEAIKQASIAASDVYNQNWVMLTQDIPEWLLLGTKFGRAAEKSTVRMAKMVGEDMLAPVSAKAAAYAGTLLSEGAEEGYQYITQRKALEAAKHRIDPEYEPIGVEDMLREGDFWTSATFGALGAGVFQTAGRALNKYILGKDSPESIIENKRINNIKSYGIQLKQASDNVRRAEATGDESEFNYAKAELAGVLASQSVENGNLQHLLNFLQLGEKGEVTEEQQKLYNVSPEDLDYMRKVFPDLTQKVVKLGQTYESYTKRLVKPEIASHLARNEFMREAAAARKSELEQQISAIDTTIDEAGRNRLSPNGLEWFKNERKIKNNLRQIKLQQNRLKQAKDAKEKNIINKTIESFAADNKRIRESIKTLKKAEGYDQEQQSSDKSIINSFYPTQKGDKDLTNTNLLQQDKLISKLFNLNNYVKELDKEVEFLSGAQQKADEGKLKEQEPAQPSEAPKEAEREGEVIESEYTESDLKERDRVINIQKKFGKRSLNQLLDLGKVGKLTGAINIDNPSVNPDTGEADIFDITKQGDTIVATNTRTGEAIDITHLGDSSLNDAKILLDQEPILKVTSLKTSEGDIDITEDEALGTDITEQELGEEIDSIPLDTVSGEEVIISNDSNKEDVGKDDLELGYMYNEATQLNQFLSDPNNTLEGYKVVYSIPSEQLSSLKDKKLTKKLVNDLDIYGQLVDPAGNPVGEKMFLYKPGGKAWQPKRLPLSIQIMASGNPKSDNALDKELYAKKQKAIEDYYNSLHSNLVSFRSQITKALKVNKEVFSTGLKKSRGLFNNAEKGIGRIERNKLIKEALFIDPRFVRLSFSKPNKDIVDSKNVRVGTHKGEVGKSGGSIYMHVNLTANGQPRLLKLNPTRISREHATIIFNAFKHAFTGTNSFESEYPADKGVTGGLTCKEVLHFLVNHGDLANMSKNPMYSPEDVNEARYQELLKKQLYFDKVDGLIHYGEKGTIDPSSIDISSPEATDFINHLTANMNYAIRQSTCEKEVKQFKIGSFEVTQQDVKDKLTYQGAYAKLGMVQTDVQFTVEGKSVTKNAIVSVNSQALETGVKVPKVKKVTQPTEVKPVITEAPEIKLTESDEDIMQRYFPTRRVGVKPKIAPENIQQTTKWFRKVLGDKIPTHIVDDYITIITATGSFQAYGQVKDASIILAKNAEKGTGYHEAFHIVSLYFLSEDQRQELYNYKRSKVESLKGQSDTKVEEALAEDFREYMLSNRTKTFSQKILDFFTRLYNNIISLFVDPSTRLSEITEENIFNKIEQGYFKRSKVKPENTKKYQGYDYLRKVEGFTVRQTMDIVDGLLGLLVSRNELTKVENVSKIRWEAITDYLQSFVEDNSSVKSDTIQHYVSLYNRILEPKVFAQFKELLEDRLIAMNIRRKVDNVENEDGTDYSQEEISLEDEIRNYDRANYEFNGRDNTLANIKLFLATIPKSNQRNPYTGMPKSLDFATAWSRLMRDLHDAVDIKEVEEILDKKKANNYFYKLLLDGIVNEETDAIVRTGLKQASEDFRTQFMVAIDKHRHKFYNVVVADKTVTEKGKKKDITTYRTLPADISSAQNELTSTWSRKFYEQAKFFDYATEKINRKAILDLSNRFVNNIYTPIGEEYRNTNNINDIEGSINNIISILSEIGIKAEPLTIQGIIELLGPGNTSYGLHTLITDILSGIFGGKGVLVELSSNKHIGKLSKEERGEQIEKLLGKESKIRELADYFIQVDDSYIADTILGPDSATYYSYSQPCFVTWFNKLLRGDKNFLVNLSNVTSNKHSIFLEQMRKGDFIEIGTYSSFRRDKKSLGYLDLEPADDMLNKIAMVNDNILPFPTLADKKTYPIFVNAPINKLKHLTDFKNVQLPKEIVDIFKGYYLDEVNRIEQVKRDLAEAIQDKNYSKLIQGMHYQSINPDGTPKLLKDDGTPLNDGNGLKFHIFVGANKHGNLTDVELHNIIVERIKETLEEANKLGLIRINKKDNNIYGITNVLLDGQLIHDKSNSNEFKSESNAVYSIIADYTINTMIANIETQKLFSMDPAYYKRDKVTGSTIEDMIKRLSALIAPGDQLRTRFDKGEFSKKSDVYSGPDKYKVATIQDYVIDFAKEHPEVYTRLHKQFEVALKREFKDLSDAQIKKMVDDRLDAYHTTNTTDAQAYITPAFYRELKTRLGEWSNEDQVAYDLLMSGKDLTAAEYVVAGRLLANPMKFVHFGTYFENNYGIPVYDKMSMATLWPNVVKDTKLEVLYNRMADTDSPIDMIKLESAVKAGNRSRIQYLDKEGNINNDLVNNNIAIFEQDLRFLRRQQVTDPHGEEERLLATQVKKIVLANLIQDKAVYHVDGYDKPVTGKQIASLVNKVYSALSDKGMKDLKDRLGITGDKIDPKKLYDELRANAIRSNMPYQVIDALLYEEGKPITNLDLLADRKWVESKLISVVNKHVIDLMTPGDAYYQMSNFGLMKPGVTDDLRLMDEQGRMEIKLSITLFKDIIPEYKDNTFEQNRRWLLDNSELLEGIGYRIPTQGQNSAIAFIVKDILPESTANTVILPLYFTALTGSDFDIDKLFLARYNYMREGKDISKYTFIQGDNDTDLATEDTTLAALYRQNYYEYNKLYYRLKELVAVRDEASVKELYKSLDGSELKLFKEVLNNMDENWDTATLTLQEFETVVDRLISNPSEADYIKANKGKSVYELNSKKALQNQILDLMKSSLTSKEHILHTKTPLDTFTGKLKEMAKELRVLKGTTKEFKSLQSIAPNYQSSAKRAYTEGKRGIGPFALNNVHHALSQLFDFGFDLFKGQMKYGKVEHFNYLPSTLSLSGLVGKDKMYIEDWLSALINAHVDIAKDPYIFDLGVNQSTYDLVNLLIRSGYGENTFWFMNQPVFEMKASTGELKSLAIKSIMTNNPSIPYKDASQIVTVKIDKMSSLDVLMSSNLKSNIVPDINEEQSWDWYVTQIAVRNVKGEIEDVAQSLGNAVRNSRVDSKGYGTNLVDVYEFNKRLDTAMNKTFMLRNYKQMIEQSFLGTLKKNSIDFMLKFYGDISLSSSAGFLKIYEDLSSFIHYKKGDRAGNEFKRKKLRNEIYSSLVGLHFTNYKGFNLTQREVKDLFVGKESVGSRLYDIANNDRYKDLKDNEVIKQIKPIKSSEHNIWFVKALLSDKSDKWLRDAVTDAWEELFDDPRTEIRQLANDLALASFYLSGFNRRLYSFHHYLPVKFLKEAYITPGDEDTRKESARSFNDFIGATLKHMDTSTVNPTILERIKADVKSNSPELFVSDETKGASVSQYKGGFVVHGLTPVGYNAEEEAIYPLIFTKSDGTYGEFIGLLKDAPFYKDLPQKSIEKQGHVFRAHYISAISAKGALSIITDEELLKKVDPDKKITYIQPMDRVIVEEYKTSVKEQPIIEQSTTLTDITPVKPSDIEQSLWDVMSDVGRKQVANASVNSTQEEYNKIVELIKQCHSK